MADRSDALRLKSRIVKGKSGTLETEQGTLYVSQPYRSESNMKLRALVAFAPRTSRFDLRNVDSGRDEFRGFFTLFWISMFILSIRSSCLCCNAYSYTECVSSIRYYF
jgi:sterol O-acyltransferase